MRFDPLGPVRGIMTSPLRRSLGEAQVSFDDHPGDPGLFGPGSVTWQVHADTPAMLIGGVSSLMLQMLHPGAMAGVADHSVYEDDPFGRLQRTGTFVGGTTFGSTPVAERLIEIVREVHRSVIGVRPDGITYAASDPDLLCWVHVAEHAQFLRAHQLFGVRPLPAADVDRYFTEVAEVARRLGATGIPTDAVGVDEYFASMRPQLCFSEQTSRALHYILAPKSKAPMDRAAYTALVRASAAILPDWASHLLGICQPWPELVANRVTAWGLCRTLRWALGPNEALRRSMRRAESEAA